MALTEGRPNSIEKVARNQGSSWPVKVNDMLRLCLCGKYVDSINKCISAALGELHRAHFSRCQIISIPVAAYFGATQLAINHP